MSTILDRIRAYKLDEIAAGKSARPLAVMEAAARAAPPVRPFAAALRQAAATGYGLIAEIKRASPSKGLIRADFDPPALARAYAAGGASCLSVLTDTPSFQGEGAHLTAAREACELPVLRKDFIFDPWQVAEARALGADCILIILACTEDDRAAELAAAAAQWGMDVLVEIHDRAELDRALRLPCSLVGINNRNLHDFSVSLDTTRSLAPLVPADRMAVAESGLWGPAELTDLAGHGTRVFLVGESLMRQDDVAAATRALLSGAPAQAPVEAPAARSAG